MGFKNFSGNSNDNNNNSDSLSQQMAFAGLGSGNKYDPMDYLINYNQKFKQSPAVLYRDDIIYKTMAILIGKGKPNPLLIGPAGVGKTAIVEDIARRLANDDKSVPDMLKGWTIYELPLSSIVSGSGIVGQLEEKLETVLDFITDPKNKAIVFIDEIHLVCGHSPSYERIAQLLKPALARGDMHCIGATTTQEAKDLMKDPAFNRRFSKRIVDELTAEQTVDILWNIRYPLFQHYNNMVIVTQEICEATVALADQYRTVGSHRPDNAITLLDRTCGEAVINRKKMEIAAQNDPAMLQAIQSVTQIKISQKQLKATAMSLMTGDAGKTDLDENKLDKEFARIKGQDDILKELKESLIRFDLRLYEQTKPVTFLFAGTSGVGKTEVAKIIAETLTGVKPITINMTEYHSAASINRLIGSPDGYVGSDSKKELPFDILESNPYQVILLDEFEKGDNAVQRLFMSAFDEGYIKTAKGTLVDFSKSIIIATTNAGHKEIKNTLGFGTSADNEKASKQTVVKELSQFFDTELLNRFMYIHTFNSLNESTYRDIVQDIYKRDIANIRKEHSKFKFKDEIPADELDAIVKETYVPAFGARPAAKAVRKYIENAAITQKMAAITMTTNTAIDAEDENVQ